MDFPIPSNPLTQILLDTSIISVTDSSGKIIYVNNNFCTISGYSKEELLGKDHSILKSGKQGSKFYENLWATIKNEELWKGELCNINKKGIYYWVETSITSYYSSSNDLYYLAIYNDITTRKRSLETSKKRAQLQSLLAILSQQSLIGKLDIQFFIEQVITMAIGAMNMTAGLIIKPCNDREVYLTDTIIGFTGNKNNKTIVFDKPTSNIFMVTLNSITPVTVDEMNRDNGYQMPDFLLQQNATSAIFNRIGDKERPIAILALLSKEKHIFDQNEYYFVQSISNIIAEFIFKKQAENALIKEKETSEQYLNIVDVIILALNKRGEIILANKKVSEILGYSQDDLLGMNWFDNFIAEKSRKIMKNNFSLYLENDITEDLENKLNQHIYNIVTKNKEKRLIKWNNTRVYENKNVISILSSGEDITELAKAKKEHEKLQQELQQAQKMEALGKLTGGIAHDFNNILAGILGFTQLAIENTKTNNTQNIPGYLKEINNSSLRAKDIITQMLNYSRTEKNIHSATLLPELVNDTLNMLRSTIPASITFNKYIENNIPAVYADPTNLNQVIMNLLINARDSMSGKGSLTISISECNDFTATCNSCNKTFSGNYVQLSVADTGTGIDKNIINNVFDSNFTTKEDGKGYGIGLSTVHRIVHESDGHILIETSDKGTIFNILFKIATGDIEPVDTRTDTKPVKKPIDTDKHILIIDDENTIAAYLGELFTQVGYKASVFTDPTEALKDFSSNPERFDIAITDQTMPIITGEELAKKFLKLKPDLPIILCTGHSDLIDKEKAASMNIRGFLEKPVETHVLLKCVTDLLEKKHPDCFD